MTSSSVKKGHVYFGSEDCLPRDNTLIVKQISPGEVQVHLGFLQFQHTYSISFEIPKPYFTGYDLESVLKAAEKSLPNVNCKIISIKEKADMYEFIIEFHAHKERLLKEEIRFHLDDDFIMRIELHARVLGPGKGTPLLKSGIKCIRVVKDDLSEISDWQG